MKIILVGLAAGAGFGAAASLLNAVSSPYSKLGAPVADTAWASVAKVLSMWCGAGWAWAAFAVLMGLLAGAWRRGAAAGALSLLAATAVYYLTDGFLRDEPLALYTGELALWGAASVVLGSLLGAVGSAVRRPGVIGLLAGLVVPVGAVTQLVVFPSRPGVSLTPVIVVAEATVWVAAVIAAGWVVRRYRVARRATAAA